LQALSNFVFSEYAEKAGVIDFRYAWDTAFGYRLVRMRHHHTQLRIYESHETFDSMDDAVASADVLWRHAGLKSDIAALEDCGNQGMRRRPTSREPQRRVKKSSRRWSVEAAVRGSYGLPNQLAQAATTARFM
jgi:hypothetical protein